MANLDPFDLSHAIQDWRQKLAKEIDRPVDLDELESHLRDSIDNGQARGLSEEDAFAIASAQLGKNDELVAEFGKLYDRKLKFDDRLWWLFHFQWCYLLQMRTFEVIPMWMGWRILLIVGIATGMTLLVVLPMQYIANASQLKKQRSELARLAPKGALFIFLYYLLLNRVTPLLVWDSAPRWFRRALVDTPVAIQYFPALLALAAIFAVHFQKRQWTRKNLLQH